MKGLFGNHAYQCDYMSSLNCTLLALNASCRIQTLILKRTKTILVSRSLILVGNRQQNFVFMYQMRSHTSYQKTKSSTAF